jgi:hypothetical protein
VVKFNELNFVSTSDYKVVAAPAVSFAIIVVPMIDVLRVMSIRIAQKRSPFSPDNNHVHHRLLGLFPNHFKVTCIIVATNILIIGFALMLNHFALNVNLQFLCIFTIGVILSTVPSILLKRKASKHARLKTANQF